MSQYSTRARKRWRLVTMQTNLAIGEDTNLFIQRSGFLLKLTFLDFFKMRIADVDAFRVITYHKISFFKRDLKQDFKFLNRLKRQRQKRFSF